MSSTKNLTSGPLGRKILFFSLPLMFSHILQILFNMSDLAVAGHFAGSTALGAVGSTTTLVALFTDFLIGVGSGVNVFTARFIGAKSQKDIEQTVHTSAILCFLCGAAVMLIGIIFARPFLTLLNTKDEFLESAVLYLKIYFWGMPALAVFNFGNGVLSASGNTKFPLLVLSGSGIINVLLNLFFVIVLKTQVAGVAIASVISQYLSAVAIIIYLFKSDASFALRLSKLRLTKDKVKCILSIGLPAGIQNAIFQIANLFIQGGVNTFDATMVAGNAAASNADVLVYDIMAAFYIGCTSFMGQNYGAGKKDRMLKSYFISLAYAFGFGAFFGITLVTFGNGFLGLFTAQPEVIEAGMKRLSVMGFSYAISAFMDCTIAASRGIGKSFVPTIIVILGSCVFRIAWVYTIFAHYGTIFSLYILYAFSWSITAIAEIIYFARVYKKEIAKTK